MNDPSAFVQRIARARAEQVLDTPGGYALLSKEHFAHAHDHNVLWVLEPVHPATLLDATETVLAGLDHRRVEVPDNAVADSLVEAFTLAGYSREIDVVMTKCRPTDAGRPDGSGVVELDLDERIATAARSWLADTTEDIARELGERARGTAAVVDATFLAVRADDGTTAAYADLYVCDDLAQVEEVFTFDDHRGKGHASRLVSAAVHRATVDRDRTVFLVADAGDWPKDLYQRLGFDVTGTHTVFRKTVTDRRVPDPG